MNRGNVRKGLEPDFQNRPASQNSSDSTRLITMQVTIGK
jgi:hypothetical protein